MTPYEFAKRECANIRKDGSCLGFQAEGLIDIGIPVTPREKCLLSHRPIKPCQYFEKCVLPLADQASPKSNPGLQAQRLEARRIYLTVRAKEIPEVGLRTCPDCGGLLAKRQRTCTKCARNRRLASYRKRRQKQSMSAPQLTAL